MNLSQDIVGVVNQNGCHPHQRKGGKSKQTEGSSQRNCPGGISMVDLKCSNERKSSDTPERQSSHKENICLAFHNGEDMTKMNKDCSPGTSRKLPPFRTGKYTPKDDVYRDSPASNRTVLVMPNSKDVVGKKSSSPQPFRLGKYVPDDSSIYSLVDVPMSKSPRNLVQSLTPRPRSCSPAQKSPTHEAKSSSAERLTVRFATHHHKEGRKSLDNGEEN